MDDYDKKAWDALERERRRQLARSPRRLVPGPVRERAGKLARSAHDGASSVPGFEQAEDMVAEVLRAAGEVGAKLAADSLRQSRIISAYTDAGHPVELITDVRELALRDIDKVKPSFVDGRAGRRLAARAAAVARARAALREAPRRLHRCARGQPAHARVVAARGRGH